MTRTLKGKTMFITGGSRGIGLEIALRAARDGANIALIAKTAEPQPKLAGTVFTAAEQIEAAGGRSLPIVGDIRDESQVDDAVAARAPGTHSFTARAVAAPTRRRTRSVSAEAGRPC